MKFFKLLFFISILFPAPFLSFSEEIRKEPASISGANSSIQGSQPMIEKTKLAVADFDVKGNIQTKDAGASIAEILEDIFQKTGSYDIYERSQLGKILEEQKLSDTGFVNADTAVKIGELTGVKKIIVGSIIEFGGVFTLSARIIDAETGKIENSALVSADSEKEILDKINLLSIQLQGKQINMEEETNPANNAEMQSTGRERAAENKRYAAVLSIRDNNGLKCVLNRGSFDGVSVGDTYNVYIPRYDTSPITGKPVYRGNTQVGKLLVSYVEDGMSMGDLSLNNNTPEMVGSVMKNGIANYTLSRYIPLYFDFTVTSLDGLSFSTNAAMFLFSLPVMAGITWFPGGNDYFWVGADAGVDPFSFIKGTGGFNYNNYMETGGRMGVYVSGNRSNPVKDPLGPGCTLYGFELSYYVNPFRSVNDTSTTQNSSESSIIYTNNFLLDTHSTAGLAWVVESLTPGKEGEFLFKIGAALNFGNYNGTVWYDSGNMNNNFVEIYNRTLMNTTMIWSIFMTLGGRW